MNYINQVNTKFYNQYNNSDSQIHSTYDATPLVPANDVGILPRKPKVLIIDDEQCIHSSIKMILYKTNYDIVHTYNANEGINYLKDNHNNIDIILLDMMMPDLTGLEVLEIIKNDCIIRNYDLYL